MVSGSRVSKAYLDLGSFRRAAPRAVGSRRRVGLLARPSSAGVGSGRRRGSFGRVPAAFVWGCRTRQEARDAQGRLAAAATGPGTFDSRSTGCNSASALS
jgi:hypothetical protein